MVALAFMAFGTANAAAQTETAEVPVKMPYIDQSHPDSIIGVTDTIRAGFNKAAAVGSAIGFGNTTWGCNWIGVLGVDVSAVPGTVQKATLKAKISGSTDSKRTTGWGVALTDNAFSADLTYTTAGEWAPSALLNGGAQVWTTTKAGATFEEHEWDITEALSGGKTSATLLVFETAAAGGYMTEAYVELEIEEYESTSKEIDFEDGDVSMFSIFDAGRMTITAVDDATNGTKVANFTCTNRNALPLGLYDFTDLTGKATMVAFEFDFNMGSVAGHHRITIGDALVHNGESGGFSVSSKNNYGYGANGAIFYLGTDRGNLGGGNENYFKINETPAAGSTLDVKADEVFGQWLHAEVMVNVDARKVTYAIYKGDADEPLFSGIGVPFMSDAATACTEFDVSFSNTGSTLIDNLDITSFKSNATFADYTIKYVDANGNEIKEARTGNGQVGKQVKLVDSDKAAITIDGVKYVYDTDDSESVVIAESGTVITVTFREANKYYIALTLKTTDNVTLKQLRGDDLWFWEGEKYDMYPERGMLSNGKYYFAPANVTDSKGNPYNAYRVSLPGAIEPLFNKQQNKWYIMTTINEYAPVDSVAYYSDFERLALPTTDEGKGTGLGQLSGTVNSWYSFSGSNFERFAGGRGIRLDVGSYVWTEPIAEAGTYKGALYGRNDISEGCPNPYALGYELNGEFFKYTELVIPTWGSATTGYNIVENVAIPAGAKLLVMNDGALTETSGKANLISLDDISLTKTGEFVEPVTVGINNVVTAAQQSNVLYNLAGQAVKNATKGIYIKNGKKVVIK